MRDIITIDHLSKQFGEVKAVQDLSFRVREGELFAFLGVNGASALAKVPPCFLWKCGGAEVVVIYSGDYGGRNGPGRRAQRHSA